jgi:hypothetical protein
MAFEVEEKGICLNGEIARHAIGLIRPKAAAKSENLQSM